MYLTEKEILGEFSSICRCLDYVLKQENRIRETFQGKKRVWIVGSGSSFCLAKSAADMLTVRCNIPSFALTAGELLLHGKRYREAMQDSLVLFISRSGMTSEVLQGFENISAEQKVTTAVICANEDSVLNEKCSLSICVPWAFDESVCQTRTVGTFYACLAMITAILSGNETLKEELFRICKGEMEWDKRLRPLAKMAAGWHWKHSVILADSEISGLMEEGALAFKEICCTNSNFYHVLDVRHGPMVVVDKETFVFVMLESYTDIEKDLIHDLAKKTDYLLTFGPLEADNRGLHHFSISGFTDSIAYALPAVYLLQNITLQKALNKGVNPDQPNGLSAWIEL